MISMYKKWFIDFHDSFLTCKTVGECVLMTLLFIMLSIMLFPVSPFIWLFSIPVHGGDKK